MYRILVADDEGIMLEAFKNVISSTFGDSCIVETAKTGRAVTEIAETFHPDIVFMDIHMPGINGIQAMREIRKFNTTALFYVVSAYDKFDYAKEAIDLGVERYLTKPISKAKIIAAVEEATAKVDTKRNQRSNLLRIQEKLETVIPVVENSFVGSLLFQQEMQVADYYQQLLDIEEKQGYVMIIQFGQSYENGRLVSPVGMNVKAQDFYAELRDIVKSSFSCAVGSIMSNRIPIVVPCALSENPYEERIDLVEQARSLITRLEDRIEAKFRVGIGRVREMQEMERSYREALRALNGSKSRVIHIEDLSQNGVYDEEFPVEMEKNIFRYLEEGKEKECIQEINVFFDWMVAHYADDMNNIRLKTLEYIIWGEKKAFEAGAINYGFSYRRDYLDAAMACTGYEELRKWFLDKMVNACRAIRDQKEDQSNSAAKKAMLYIQENYNKDISLDDVSGIVNISPYYFSKIFKEETGEREKLLEVKNLSFGYTKEHQTLHNVSLSIDKGEMVSIVGRNGAGKSTFSKLVCGFEDPDSGEILFHGKDLLKENIRHRAKYIGYVMQNPNQMISKTMIYEEVALSLQKAGMPEEKVRQKVEDTLKICGLYPFRNWPVSALSFGQKKRVTIASVLVQDPELIILDEPTAGQDFKHYTEIMEFLRKLNERGVTVVMITHDMHLMLEYTPRALVFSDGQLIADRRASEVLCDPKLIKRAALKETSLFTLANHCAITPPEAFVERFIGEDREVRSHGC